MGDLNAGSGGLGQVTWVIGDLNMGEAGYEVMKVNWLTEVSTCVNPQNLVGNSLMYQCLQSIKVGKMRKLPHHVMFQIGRQKPKPSEWAFSVL